MIKLINFLNIFNRKKDDDKTSATKTDTAPINKVPEKAISMIKQFEGFRKNVYKCAAGVATIGYGITCPDIIKAYTSKGITPEGAEDLLENLLENMSDKINELVEVELDDNKLSALLSFTYNLGMTAFEKSTLLKLINSSSPIELIEKEFLKFIYITVNKQKVKCPGLFKRRTLEAELFKGLI